MRESNFQALIVEKFIPEFYIASSIMDFNDSISMIKPTKRILFPGCLYNGKALINFKTQLIYNPINNNLGQISDFYSSLKVKLHEFDRKKDCLNEKIKLNESFILFNVKEKSTYLWSYNPQIIPKLKVIKTKDNELIKCLP